MKTDISGELGAPPRRERRIVRLVSAAPPALPGARLAGWFQLWGLYILFPAGIALPILIFPDGRLPSRRWRPVLWLTVLLSIVLALAPLVAPGPVVIDSFQPPVNLRMENPTGPVQQPARRRVQAAIDRHFCRQKYGAERVLAAFSLSLREGVYLDVLAGALFGTVDQALRPSNVSLWLRDLEAARRIPGGSSAPSLSTRYLAQVNQVPP